VGIGRAPAEEPSIQGPGQGGRATHGGSGSQPPTSHLQPQRQRSVLRSQQQSQPLQPFAARSGSHRGMASVLRRQRCRRGLVPVANDHKPTNNRKSVVAINLHACLLLLEGQGLWGSTPSFSKAGGLPRAQTNPRHGFAPRCSAGDGRSLSGRSTTVRRPVSPFDGQTTLRDGEASYQMDGTAGCPSNAPGHFTVRPTPAGRA
jgi:hypothetical protein